MQAASGARSLAIAGSLLVIAFFGPWLDVLGLVQASGWDLATSPALGWQRHAAWACPAGGAALAWASIGRVGLARRLAIGLGGLVVAVAAYHLAGGLVEILRAGAWLVLGGATVALVAGASEPRRAWAMLAGVAVIAGFFLPWVGEGRAALSGFDLARLAESPPGSGLPPPSWLFLIPLLGATATLAALTARTRRGAVLAGAGVLVVVAYLYLRLVDAVLGWGAWLTLAAAAFALVAALLLTPRAEP